ncbi:hypothetical protein HN415_07385 [Candidatus Woesearchaeota archaeon]|jgi:hypothetical protein|nr:hypothetical protein [Candidatus Woesearchaeota archaeon]
MEIDLSKIQPHSIGLGKDSLDFLVKQSDEFFENNPIHIGIYGDQNMVSIDGDHRIYTFNQIKKTQYPSIIKYDLNTSEGRIDLSEFQFEKFVDTLNNPRLKKYIDKLPKPKEIKIESILDIVKFVQSEGIYRSKDLSASLYDKKDNSTIAYDRAFSNHHDLSYDR